MPFAFLSSFLTSGFLTVGAQFEYSPLQFDLCVSKCVTHVYVVCVCMCLYKLILYIHMYTYIHMDICIYTRIDIYNMCLYMQN